MAYYNPIDEWDEKPRWDRMLLLFLAIALLAGLARWLLMR